MTGRMMLVTGGAGFIGSAIARALIERGDAVRVLDNMSTGFEENVPSGAELVRGDITNPDLVKDSCKGVDVVFHEAAFKSVPKSLDDPSLAESCNSLGTINVLMAAEAQGVQRVVYASSSSAYGDLAAPVKAEDMVTNPISPYGVSKLAGEHYCRVWSQLKGLSTVSLRYFNVFGPGQRPDSQYSAVFPAFIASLLSLEPPQIFGDGEQTRDFTFLDDVVRANLMAADADSRVDGLVMNVSAGAPKTVNEVARSISAALDIGISPQHLAPRLGDIRHSQGDGERAREILGWAAVADWQESVNATVEWLRENMLGSAAQGAETPRSV